MVIMICEIKWSLSRQNWNKIGFETPEIKILSVALLSQAKQSECGMAQLSPCIAGFNDLDKWYLTWNTWYKILSVALLSQAKQFECGMAQLSHCIAGFIFLTFGRYMAQIW